VGYATATAAAAAAGAGGCHGFTIATTAAADV